MGAVERGSSIRQAARRFAVSPWAAIKLMQRVRATGSAAPARFGGHRRPLLEPYEAALRGVVAGDPGHYVQCVRTARPAREKLPPPIQDRAASLGPRRPAQPLPTPWPSSLSLARAAVSACVVSCRREAISVITSMPTWGNWVTRWKKPSLEILRVSRSL